MSAASGFLNQTAWVTVTSCVRSLPVPRAAEWKYLHHKWPEDTYEQKPCLVQQIPCVIPLYVNWRAAMARMTIVHLEHSSHAVIYLCQRKQAQNSF